MDLKDATICEIMDEISYRTPLDLTSIEGYKSEFDEEENEIIHNQVTVVSVKSGHYGEVYLSEEDESGHSEFNEQWDGPCVILVMGGTKR